MVDKTIFCGTIVKHPGVAQVVACLNGVQEAVSSSLATRTIIVTETTVSVAIIFLLFDDIDSNSIVHLVSVRRRRRHEGHIKRMNTFVAEGMNVSLATRIIIVTETTVSVAIIFCLKSKFRYDKINS